jgi:hypothetical protein
MRKITEEKLQEIIEKHGKWMNGDRGGERADLRHVDFSNTNLSYTDLSYTDFSYTNLSHTDLRGTDLSYTNLSGANLENTYLGYTNLSYTNLSHANLSTTDLSYTNLSYTNLSHANLSNAKMDRVNLSGARLCNCIGNGREIKSLRMHEYTIVYTMDQLAIGYQQFPITDWFTRESISIILDQEDLDFWNENKDFIKILIGKYQPE